MAAVNIENLSSYIDHTILKADATEKRYNKAMQRGN